MKRVLAGGAAGTILLAAGTALGQGLESLQLTAELSGAQEVVVVDEEFMPGGVDTPATGQVSADFDGAFTRVAVDLAIQNLTGSFAAAHFHCGRAGQNGPVVFGLVEPGPLSFDGERIAGELTNAHYTGADCEEVVGRPINNIASLAFAMRDGLIYANVHTDAFPAGEIRGQMHQRSGEVPGNGNPQVPAPQY